MRKNHDRGWNSPCAILLSASPGNTSQAFTDRGHRREFNRKMEVAVAAPASISAAVGFGVTGLVETFHNLIQFEALWHRTAFGASQH